MLLCPPEAECCRRPLICKPVADARSLHNERQVAAATTRALPTPPRALCPLSKNLGIASKSVASRTPTAQVRSTCLSAGKGNMDKQRFDEARAAYGMPRAPDTREERKKLAARLLSDDGEPYDPDRLAAFVKETGNRPAVA